MTITTGYVPENEEEREFLAAYDASKFPIFTVTVDTVVHQWHEERGLPFGGRWKVLLIRRKNYPYRGRWALPGGFMEPRETAQEAAAREVREEAGLELLSMAFHHVADRPDRDPRGRTISLVFTAHTKGQPFAGDDAVEARWFSYPEAQSMDLAFDHNEILKKAM